MTMSIAARKPPEPGGAFRTRVRFDPMTGKAVFFGLVARFEIACGVEFGHPRTTI
jgi:hypothetical protein